MAKTYLFLKPGKLPLLPTELTETSISPLGWDEAQACLRQAIPSLTWSSDGGASGESAQGWVEFAPPGHERGESLSLRCSLAGDYTALVQGLCDRFGWVAFDEGPTMFQPFAPPAALS